MRWMIAIFVWSAGLLGCTGRSDSPVPAAQDAEITLALNWFPEAEHGGYYAAVVHGYYEDAGLNVEILPGGQGAPVVQQVASRAVTFGVDNADKVLLGRAQQADVIALMAPLQSSPRCVMVHRQSGIRSFDDLKDVTLAMNDSGAWAQFLRRRLPLEDVRIVPNPTSLALFLRDMRFAQQAYSFSEPYLAEKEGAEPLCLMVSDLGFNPYTSALLANGRMLRERPQTVRKFVAASIRGWQTYLENPEPTNRYINQINPKMDLETLAYGAEALRPLCRDGLASPDELGSMSPQRWQTLAEQLVEIELIKPGEADPESAFTTQFLPDRK